MDIIFLGNICYRFGWS